CSAMIREHLGGAIDIHTGGLDLTFPHHENEIAQSEAANDECLARYWMHNGMVNVDGEKMSKSLGNFTTIRQLLDAPEGPHPMAMRLFVLQAQYRKPVDFTADAIASAKNSWQTIQAGLLFGHQYGDKLGWTLPATVAIDRDSDAVNQFQSSMDDDFNTPGAVAALFDLAKELRRQGNLIVHEGKPDAESNTLFQQWQTLVGLAQVLGIEAEPEAEGDAVGGLSDAEIDAKITQRRDAKKAKNYAEADKIRDELSSLGITLIDKPGGVTEWHR
ncbi:MAG: DALR domain-containing protein, partial [Cyanobacteria bacterium J06632_22]